MPRRVPDPQGAPIYPPLSEKMRAYCRCCEGDFHARIELNNDGGEDCILAKESRRQSLERRVSGMVS